MEFNKIKTIMLPTALVGFVSSCLAPVNYILESSFKVTKGCSLNIKRWLPHDFTKWQAHRVL